MKKHASAHTLTNDGRRTMINIDADGFLVDWRGYVIPTHFPDMTIDEFNSLESTYRSALLKEVYEKDPQLFYKLEPLPGAVEFMQTIMNLGEPWRILTSAGTDHPDFDVAAESKILNLKKHFGISREYVTVCESSESKRLYVENKDDILIDDFRRNIEQWRLAGGIGIHFIPTVGYVPVLDAVRKALHQESAEDAF